MLTIQTSGRSRIWSDSKCLCDPELCTQLSYFMMWGNNIHVLMIRPLFCTKQDLTQEKNRFQLIQFRFHFRINGQFLVRFGFSILNFKILIRMKIIPVYLIILAIRDLKDGPFPFLCFTGLSSLRLLLPIQTDGIYCNDVRVSTKILLQTT